MTAPLWLLTLITFSGTLAMHIFVPALPEAAHDLGSSIGGMQMTMSVYILGLAFGQLVYGPLSDRTARPPASSAIRERRTWAMPVRFAASFIWSKTRAGSATRGTSSRNTAPGVDAPRRPSTVNGMQPRAW